MFIIIIITALLIVFVLIRMFIYQKRNIPARSFSAALASENNGDFEEALSNYEIALTEVNKTKRNKNLRITIIQKIKVLQTVVQYQKNVLTLNKKVF